MVIGGIRNKKGASTAAREVEQDEGAGVERRSRRFPSRQWHAVMWPTSVGTRWVASTRDLSFPILA